MKAESERPERVTAYSYQRFSHPSQSEGDSIRRQSELARRFCLREGWTLDETTTYRDLGVSAWKGKNALVGNLAEILRAVKEGKIAPGSALIVESLDRISRQGIDKGYEVIKSLLNAGITIVTLNPERKFDASATEGLMKGVLEILIILELAAEESRKKSERIGAAWQQKRKDAIERGVKPTRKAPAWIQAVGDEKDFTFKLIPERAAVVRKIFKWAAVGLGAARIVKKLNEEGIPAFGSRELKPDKDGVVRYQAPDGDRYGCGQWHTMYIKTLLHDRKAVGELQLKGPGGRPEGEPLKNYYPAAIAEKEWLAARATRTGKGAKAKGKQGRGGWNKGRKMAFAPREGRKHVDLFAGLMVDALDGSAFYGTTRTDQGKQTRLYVNLAGTEKGGVRRSFSIQTFERAILSVLREVSPKELATAEDRNEVAELTAELAGTRSHYEELTAALDKAGRPVVAVAKKLGELEDRVKELEEQLNDARAKAAIPPGTALQDVQTLADALDAAADKKDTRVRLRAAIRRVVDSMYVVTTVHGKDRCAGVQIHFRDSTQPRIVTIFRRPPRVNANAKQSGWWWAHSLRRKPGDGITFDLRKRADAERLAASLFTMTMHAVKTDLDAEVQKAGIPSLAELADRHHELEERREAVKAIEQLAKEGKFSKAEAKKHRRDLIRDQAKLQRDQQKAKRMRAKATATPRVEDLPGTDMIRIARGEIAVVD
jgi:DNA invertase Pin-like site-specific DNA recombinase